MSSQNGTVAQKRRMFFALVCLAATAALLPAGAMAKEAGTCTPRTTLGRCAPEASQGSLFLVQGEGRKPPAGVPGGWGRRGVPLRREAARETQGKGMLA